MTSVQRPQTMCAHPGCRLPQRTGSSTCAAHTNAKWDTRKKRSIGHHSAEYHRERQAVKRDRWHCHLDHLGGCRGRLHTHHTREDTHHRSTLAPLCMRHHMQLEQQGKSGPLAQALEVVMKEVNAR